MNSIHMPLCVIEASRKQLLKIVPSSTWYSLFTFILSLTIIISWSLFQFPYCIGDVIIGVLWRLCGCWIDWFFINIGLTDYNSFIISKAINWKPRELGYFHIFGVYSPASFGGLLSKFVIVFLL